MVDSQEYFLWNTDFIKLRALFKLLLAAYSLSKASIRNLRNVLEMIKVFGRRTSINLTASNPEFTQFFSEDEQQDRKLIFSFYFKWNCSIHRLYPSLNDSSYITYISHSKQEIMQRARNTQHKNKNEVYQKTFRHIFVLGRFLHMQ